VLSIYNLLKGGTTMFDKRRDQALCNLISINFFGVDVIKTVEGHNVATLTDEAAEKIVDSVLNAVDFVGTETPQQV
jgi:hypothetical protein